MKANLIKLSKSIPTISITFNNIFNFPTIQDYQDFLSVRAAENFWTKLWLSAKTLFMNNLLFMFVHDSSVTSILLQLFFNPPIQDDESKVSFNVKMWKCVKRSAKTTEMKCSLFIWRENLMKSFWKSSFPVNVRAKLIIR